MKIHPFLSAALAPVGTLYGAALARHIRMYTDGRRTPAKLKGVVISVGNLTVGGTGKTPFVIYMMHRMLAAKLKAAVLTRGYRSRRRAGANVGAQSNASDEALLLAAALGDVRIGVGADRYRVGKNLESAGVEWFVLDDGFQHVQLARDVNILLLDATVPLAGARVLPAGPYREPLTGMKRADVIVLTRSSGNTNWEAQIRKYSPSPIFHAQTALRRVCRLAGGKAEACGDEWKREKLFAFCGIGNPKSFLADLARWGGDVGGHLAFRDHHAFRPRDIAKLETAAKAAGATALVCTEKDRFNLDGAGTISMPLFACEMDLVPLDEGGFWKCMRAVLARKRPEVNL